MSKNNATKKSSLATQVIVSALGAAVVIVGILIAFDAFRLSSLVSVALERRAEQVASLQGNALLQPLADYETDVVETMLTALISDPEMQAVRVTDVDGNVVVEKGAWSSDGTAVLTVEKVLDIADGDSSEHLGVFALQVSRAGLIEARDSGIRNGVVSIVVVALALLLVLKLSFLKITRPLESMIGVMGALSLGDSKVDVPAQSRNDEIGRIATAVQIFKENAIERTRLEAEAEQATARAEAEKKLLLSEMADAFEASVRGVVDIVAAASTEMQLTAQSMMTTTEQTNQLSAAVASASDLASENVHTVAAAAEQLAASITEIGNQMTQSTRITGKASEQAQNTTEQVSSLVEAANKIGEVVKLISDIAEQTNLLALNATIEAARAGEAGKGFAVVASEVKSLATQTAKATEEISSHIDGIQLATTEAAEAITGIAGTIGEINHIAGAVAAAVEQQGAATQEISRNVQAAATGTQEVNSNISGVTQAVSETGVSANQVLKAAGELSQQSDFLRCEVDTFIEKVRAA